MVVWFILVLILTQSYTASLTSTLTVEKLVPTVTSINELIKRGENVGYEEGSYSHDLLKQYFDESKLKSFSSPEEMDTLFSLGSAKGGIGAAFDDYPALNLFLSKYSQKYTMVPTIVFRTSGYGFVSLLYPSLYYEVFGLLKTQVNCMLHCRFFKKDRLLFPMFHEPS